MQSHTYRSPCSGLKKLYLMNRVRSAFRWKAHWKGRHSLRYRISDEYDTFALNIQMDQNSCHLRRLNKKHTTIYFTRVFRSIYREEEVENQMRISVINAFYRNFQLRNLLLYLHFYWSSWTHDKVLDFTCFTCYFPTSVHGTNGTVQYTAHACKKNSFI